MEIEMKSMSLTARISEILRVIKLESSETARDIRSTWVDYLELRIEPTGWQAQWKIPRVICEELNLQYPTVVLGMVEDVVFDELKCIFKVTAVHDENIHLPEVCDVSIADLWVTKDQIYPELNTLETAKCINQFRFFYNHIWMPWDCEGEEENQPWAQKNLNSRIKFAFDLISRKLSRPMSSHIRLLLDEAKNIKQKKDYLEIDLSDNESDEEESTNDDVMTITNSYPNDNHKNSMRQILRLHFRMNRIKDIIEILINPKMRKIYEESEFEFASTSKNKSNNYLVLQQGSLDDQIAFLNRAKSKLGNEAVTKTCTTLQEALETSNYWDVIYIPPGVHSIKFLESFNSSGAIIGLVEPTDAPAIIQAKEGEIVLLRIDGDFVLENITLDCTAVSSGVTVPRGHVIFNNCTLFDKSSSDFKQALTLFGDAKIELNNTNIENFAVGITMKSESSLELSNASSIKGCTIGIEAEDGCKLNLLHGQIIKSKNRGIIFETSKDPNKSYKKKVYEKFADIEFCEDFNYGKRFIMDENRYGNIVISNRNYFDASIVSNFDSSGQGDSMSADEDEDFVGFSDDSVVCLN